MRNAPAVCIVNEVACGPSAACSFVWFLSTEKFSNYLLKQQGIHYISFGFTERIVNQCKCLKLLSNSSWIISIPPYSKTQVEPNVYNFLWSFAVTVDWPRTLLNSRTHFSPAWTPFFVSVWESLKRQVEFKIVGKNWSEQNLSGIFRKFKDTKLCLMKCLQKKFAIFIQVN